VTNGADIEIVTAEPAAEPGDAALVERCLSGDESAAEALVGRYASRCTGLARHFLGNREEVADVVQEAFAAAFLNLKRYDQGRPFWNWLARMVVNRAIDRLRSARHRMERATETLSAHEADIPGPDRAAVGREERERVRRVLDTLPRTYRTLLVLREMEGMSAKAIGRMMNRPAATIRWRLFKARRLFRDAWLAAEREPV